MPRWAREAATLGLLAAVYFAVARASLLGALADGHVAAVWPPAGLGLALVLLGGPSRALAILVGAFFATLANGGSPAVAAGFCWGNAAEALLGAYLLRRAGFDARLERLRDVAALVGLGAALAPLPSVLAGVSTLVLAGFAGDEDVPRIAVTWWVGNGMGILLVTPALLVWARAPEPWARVRVGEALAFAGVAGVVGYLAFFADILPPAAPLGFLVFPLVIWGAVRLGTHGATLAALVLVACATLGTVRGRGPFAQGDLVAALLFLQAFASVVCISAMGLAAALAQERRAEAALRESESRFRALFDQAFDAVFLHDAAGRILDANAQAAATVGVRREALIGRALTDLFPGDDPDVSGERWSALAPGKTRAEESVLRRADGTDVPVEVRHGVVELGDAHGRVAVVRDIAERRRAEEERTRLAAQLRQAQKMEAVGTLAGGVAHDFNNLLTGIVGNIEMAAAAVPEVHPARARLRSATAAADTAARLVSQLLAFSRQQPVRGGTARTDVNAAVRQAVELLARVVEPRVTVALTLGQGVGAVATEADELQQVLINLAVNARDAMPHGGTLAIATGVETVDDTAGRPPEARPGTYARLEVRDEGEGIAPKHLDHIFEPFFTTKDVGKGTGLGLAVVWGIARQHGGWVEVRTRLGAGTTFAVLLPRLADAPAVGVAAPVGEDIPRGTETVLVVDDNPHARDVARAMLEDGGYTVLEAPEGTTALEIVQAEGDRIALVVLDLTMPGLSGRETLERLLAMRPDARVVVASGYSVDGGPDAVRGWGARRFLAKPFGRAALRRMVRDVLDE